MSNDPTGISEVFNRARARAGTLGLPYAGALLPAEAHALVQAHAATLVDVRRKPEWEYVGRPPDAVLIEWNIYPSGRNLDFTAELQAQVPDKTAPVLFMCRSGQRSDAAAKAALEQGYTQAFNVLEGFEGDKDAEGHRNTVGGWKVARLPWVQG